MSPKDIIEILGPVAALFGLGVGLYQYTVNQKWRQSKLASNQLEMLSTDPKLAVCCLFLDWTIRKLPVPQDYQIYANSKGDCFVHNWVELISAMKPESVKGEFPFPQVLYRDFFDHYFEYLERVNHYLEVGLFSLRDVSSLEYWLQEIANPRNAPPDQRAGCFRDFVRHYEYDGVEELMKRFGISFN